MDVLDFLAARPDERFGLSDLARRLQISKPTCLGIVNVLCSRGYLVRDPDDLSYGLGPALIGTGQAAQDSLAAGRVARPHLEVLSAQYDTTCTVSAVVADRVTVLAQTGPARGPVRVGQRLPFAPPVGLAYVLWDGDEALCRWLARRPALPVRLDESRLREVVRDCRARGYLVQGATVRDLRLRQRVSEAATYDLPPRVRRLLGAGGSTLGDRVYLDSDLAPRRKQPVDLVAAPVFDAHGRQEMVLTLHVGESITGAEVSRRAAALAQVADAVTAEAGSG